ncbi:MAG: tetratricopeptide repeat protein [Opitutus sp.]
MKRGSIFAWAIGCAALGLGCGWWLLRTPAGSMLPAVGAYVRLPPAFRDALSAARQAVERSPRDAASLRQLSHLYQANGLSLEARRCYDLLASTPGGLDATDRYYLADLALNDGDLEQSRTILEQVIALDGRYLPARLRLAEALFKSGQPEQAERAYQDILAIAPDEPQATLGLARVELQRGQDVAAAARLEHLVAVRPQSSTAAALLAQLLDRRGETERANAMAQASRQRPEPVAVDPWLDALFVDCFDLQRLTLKFEEYLMAGQVEQALPLLTRVEQLDPQSWIPHLLRGWTLARAKQFAQGIAEYSEALKKGGDADKIIPLLAQTYVAANQRNDALKLLEDAYRKAPDSIPILTTYSEVAVQSGDEVLARSLLTKLLQKEPYLYTPNISLAKILWTSGDRPAAVECLQRIVKVFPVDVASRGLLGQFFLENGNPSAAVAPLEQALPQVEAGSPARTRIITMLRSAYLQLASAATEQGNHAAAADRFGQAATLVPDDLEAHAGEANARVQLKQFARAADVLRRMLALQPDNPTISLSLGDMLYQDGDHHKARTVWQRALQLTRPTDAELQQALRNRITGPVTPEMFQ